LSADERCKKCLHKTFDGSSVADGCGSADEYIKDYLISSQISLLEAVKEVANSPSMASGVTIDQRGRRFIDLNDLDIYIQKQIEIIKKTNL
jgi:hypothetical protein